MENLFKNSAQVLFGFIRLLPFVEKNTGNKKEGEVSHESQRDEAQNKIDEGKEEKIDKATLKDNEGTEESMQKEDEESKDENMQEEIEKEGEAQPTEEKEKEKEESKKPVKKESILIICEQKTAAKDRCIEILEQYGLADLLINEDREKLSFNLNNNYLDKADFVIVILSGDKFVYEKNGKPSDAKLEPEQSVIFKLGYLLSNMNQNRIFIMHHEQKSFKFPSSFLGATSIPYNRDRAWDDLLVSRLKLCGYIILGAINRPFF